MWKIGRIAAAVFSVSGAACVAVPEPVDNAVDPLAGSLWVVTTIRGNPVAPPPDQRRPYLNFLSERSRVTGHTGCNILTGAYTVADSRLEFDEPLATTKRMCLTPETALQEREMISVLRATGRYEISGGTLTLYVGESIGLQGIRVEVAEAATP